MASILSIAFCVLTVLVTHVLCYDITILHTNDVHARFVQFNNYGTDCSDEDSVDGKCFGGVARRQTKVKEIFESHGRDNVLFMDAGDQFMGTLWFTVYRGMAAAQFMNELDYDVMCFGNHEFDLGVASLVSFLNNVTFPVVSSNTDVTREPRLQGKFSRSHVFTKGGEKIGVIGYITEETAYISAAGSTVSFTNILESVSEEVTLLQNQGVNKIIALGHAGYRTDQLVAAIDGVDIVVGGHTDTFLYTGEPPSSEEPAGLYPTVIEQTGGKKALVVQDFTWGKYLGYLNVTFNETGDVIAYNGNPILLDHPITEDAGVLSQISAMEGQVDNLRTQRIGFSNVLLDGERKHCRLQECNLGNLIADSIIDYHTNFTKPTGYWAPAAIALVNSGGIRASISKGTVSAGDVITVLPFGNEIDMVKIKGSNLRKQLELSVQDYDVIDQHGKFLQFSGVRVVYDLTKPNGKRVHSVSVRCAECDIPSYSPLNDSETYNVFTSSFLVGGGDGFQFEPEELLKFNTLDVNPLFDYFQRHSPVWPSTDGRIQFHTSGSSPVPPISKASVTIANYVLFFCLIVCSSIFYNRLIFC